MPIYDKPDLTNPNDAEWVRSSVLGNMVSDLAVLKLLFKKGIIDECEFLETLQSTGKYEIKRDLLEHTDDDALTKETRLYYHAGGREATALMAELAGVNSESNILMVGCGMGADARYLGKELGCRVLGIDLDFQKVYHATLRAKVMELADLVQFKMADATEMPFDDASFNVVWLQAVGLPLDIERKVIAEVRRVLVPGGTYAIQDRFKRDDLEDDSYIDAFKTYIGGRGGVFGIEEYRDILAESGFEVTACEVDKVTPFFIDHDIDQCRPYYDRGDIVGAIVVARKGG